MTFQMKYTILIVSSIFLCACGGGGGESNKDNGTITPSDTTKPTVELLSPSFSRATTSREVIVTGSASDAESSLSSVRVNNIEAFSEDSFATWSVNLPISHNINKLTLEAEDSAGNTQTQHYNISLTSISTLFSEPSTIIYNDNLQDIIILDTLQNALFKTDSNTPNLVKLPKSLLSDSSVSLSSPKKAVFDTSNQRVVVLDSRNTRPKSQAFISISSSDQQGSILKEGMTNVMDFAISNGSNNIYYLSANQNTRNGGSLSSYNTNNSLTKIISDSTHSGPSINSPSTLTVFKKKAYYIEHNSDQLILIDLSSGNRSVLSPSESNNISLAGTKNMVINHNGSFAWATDTSHNQVISIDLNTGSRRIISNKNIGNGLNFESPGSLIYDQTNNRLLVGDTELNIVFSVDIQTGNRDYFISNRYGHGPLFEKPTAIEAVSNKLAYVLDKSTKSLYEVNIVNGNRRLISSGKNSIQGPSFDYPSGLTVDVESKKAWVTDRGLASVFEIDLVNGNRHIISTQSSQEGVASYKIPVAIDHDGEQLYVSDIYHDIIQKTNSYSGETIRALHNELSDGTRIKKSLSIDIDTTNNIVYGIDQTLKSVYQLDLSSGQSKVISSSTIGSGINLNSPISIQVDENQNAYISDSKLNAIVHIDLSNGNRTILSNKAIGTGPVFKELSAISFEKQSQKLYAIDKKEKAVFSIDISTGDRSIKSR